MFRPKFAFYYSGSIMPELSFPQTFKGTSHTITVDLYFMKNEPYKYWIAENVKLFVKTWSKHGKGAGDPSYEGQEVIDDDYIKLRDITAGETTFSAIPPAGTDLPDFYSSTYRRLQFKMEYPAGGGVGVASMTTTGIFNFYVGLRYKARRYYSHTIQDFTPSPEFYNEEFFDEDFLG